ncbi:MAG: helix-turn-helix transcriptional regulator [Planctomycetota bacterium]
MGYVDKLQHLCSLRGMDQVTLAQKVGVSKSSMSRILSGSQEPKLQLASDLASALDVPLDYLVNDSAVLLPTVKTMPLTDEQLTILTIVERLGYEASIDRLLAIPIVSGSGSGTVANSTLNQNFPQSRNVSAVGILESNNSPAASKSV